MLHLISPVHWTIIWLWNKIPWPKVVVWLNRVQTASILYPLVSFIKLMIACSTSISNRKNRKRERHVYLCVLVLLFIIILHDNIYIFYYFVFVQRMQLLFSLSKKELHLNMMFSPLIIPIPTSSPILQFAPLKIRTVVLLRHSFYFFNYSIKYCRMT